MHEERVLADWGIQPERPSGRAHLLQRAAVLLVFVALAVVVTLLLGPIWGSAPVLMINLGIGVAAYWWVGFQGVLALRSAGARRCAAEQEPRLWNIAQGLAGDMGAKPPALYVIPEGGPNSLVCLARGPALAVSASLLTDYTRTELEAVVAHGLVRLSSGATERTMLASALGPLGTKSVSPVGGADDVHACAATRYPPGLVGALEKAEPRSGRFAPFWFVADSDAHRPQTERIAAIKDL